MLSPVERNYSTFDRELLAAVRGVKKFRPGDVKMAQGDGKL